MRAIVAGSVFVMLTMCFACGSNNTRPESRTEIGTHTVRIRPGCKQEETISLRNEGVQPAYQFTCIGEQIALRLVIIQDKELRINGQQVTQLEEDDEVAIKDDVILVNGKKVGTLE